MRTLAILSTIALGAAMHAPEAAAQRPVEGCPFSATLPGMYQVTRNIIADGDCISVAAGFVTIDLGGFAIRGTRETGEGIATVTPSPGGVIRGTVVRNGTVQAFRTGVNLSTATGVLVEGIRAFDNDEGIVVGEFGIVKGNILENNGAGIIVAASGIVTDNLSNQSLSGSGIKVGVFGTVTDNVAVENAGHGIVVGGQSTVTGNTAGLNELAGIFAGEGSTVMGNTSSENDVEGIRVTCPSNVIGNTGFFNTGAIDIVLIGRPRCNNVNNLGIVRIQP